jgi:Holliday junction resolvasome RuvABC endonuclease subunit
MSKTVLGLDVSSTSTGFAVVKNGRWLRTSGRFGMIKPPKGNLAEKLHYFRTALLELVSNINPDLVVIEDVFAARNIGTTKLLSRFSGVALETCYAVTHNEPLIVETTKARKMFALPGKEEAFAYVKARYKLDWEFKTMNDVSDALVLALYGNKILVGKK